MKRPMIIALAAIGMAGAPAGAQVATTGVPGFDGDWVVDARSARIGEHLGRPAAFIRANAPPILSTADFSDGTIEFDMSVLPGGNFLGLVFRYADGSNHENVYFRLHKSGEFEAVQYAPRVNGSGGTWQLYPQFFGRAVLPMDGWVHVRAEIRGSRMELFVGDSARPLIVVPRLRGLPATGRVGIWGRVNDKPDEWAVAVSNLRVRHRAPERIVAVDTTSLLPGTVTGWQVAGPFSAPDSTILPSLPANASWAPLPIEEDGLVNVTRIIRKPSAGRFIAYLRSSIQAPAPRVIPLEIGFSDDIMVWLNGVPVYRGVNSLNSQYPGFLGLAVAQNTVFLPLRAGSNELLVALADRIGGWGLRARLLDDAR